MADESILIIDDDEDFLKYISDILSNKGYKPDTAINASEAIKKIKSYLYSLILIDVRLPDVNGLSLLYKSQQFTRYTRKIIVTGYPSLDTAQKALEYGAHLYLIKPVKVEELLAMIKAQLTKRRKELRKKYPVLES